ncbi:MAG: VanZ family protein [Planctomycetia bacterium]|nr:VanZ family protein [Planctomycetia bacterium]
MAHGPHILRSSEPFAVRRDDIELRAIREARSLHLIAALMMTVSFAYVCAVPFAFASPDFGARLADMAASNPWERGRLFDWLVNATAFVPMGFAWAGACFVPFQGRSSRHSAAARSAVCCLVVACLAEIMQFWIPLRVPSLRDIVALEIGAIAGCSAWLAWGPRAMLIIARAALAAMRKGPRQYTVTRRLALSCMALCAALSVMTLISPEDCFETYRHRAFTANGVSHASASPFGASLAGVTLAAIGILGICLVGEMALDRFLPIRLPDGGQLGNLHRRGFPAIGASATSRPAGRSPGPAQRPAA